MFKRDDFAQGAKSSLLKVTGKSPSRSSPHPTLSQRESAIAALGRYLKRQLCSYPCELCRRPPLNEMRRLCLKKQTSPATETYAVGRYSRMPGLRSWLCPRFRRIGRM